MIDKRINYRFGGGYQGSSTGPAGGASSGGNYGGNTGNNQSGSGEDDARERAIAQQYSAPAPAPREERVSPIESIARIGDTSLAGKTKAEADATMESQNEVEKDAREEYISEMYTKPPVTPTEDKVPDFVKQVVTPTTPMRNRIQDERAEDIRKKELANIALQTDKSLINISDPSGQGRGIMRSFADMGTKESLMSAGKNYAKKAAINYGLQKSGLGFINPILGLASMFGFDPVGSLMAKMPKGTGTKTIDTTPGEGREKGILQVQAPKNVIEKNIQKFSPEQFNLLRKRYAELQEVMKTGMLGERKLTMDELSRLGQISKQMKDFLVSEVGGMKVA
jgi:hypothetical protein